jgi:hypothetical protein
MPYFLRLPIFHFPEEPFRCDWYGCDRTPKVQWPSGATLYNEKVSMKLCHKHAEMMSKAEKRVLRIRRHKEQTENPDSKRPNS